MKRDREGVEAAAVQEQQHPPPPPRRPPANGTAPAHSSISAHTTHTTRNFGKTPANSLGPPSGSSSYSNSISSKKPRHGLDPRASLRAAAVVVSSRPPPAAAAVTERKGRKVENGGVPSKGGGTAKEQGGGDVRVGRGGPSAKSQRKFAAVCSANFNRSMMAHKLLQENNFHVQSFGTGRDVRLPGKDMNSPEVFAFGTPYRYILDSLKSKDEEFFRKNKLLGLVARNAEIKTAPQRFQEIEGSQVAEFDVVLCFDSRVFYLVVEDLQSRDPETFKPLHVVNMTIKDSPEEAEAAANDVLFLCRTLDGVSQLEEEAAGVLDAFTKKTKRTILHQVCHV